MTAACVLAACRLVSCHSRRHMYVPGQPTSSAVPPPSPAAQQQEDLFRQTMESSLDRYQAILASLQLAPAAQRGAPPRVPLRLNLRTDARGRLSGGEASVSMPYGGKVACVSAGQAVC